MRSIASENEKRAIIGYGPKPAAKFNPGKTASPQAAPAAAAGATARAEAAAPAQTSAQATEAAVKARLELEPTRAAVAMVPAST